MPAYNFQDRFIPKILSGTKSHTIRKRRKYPTKVGDILWLYTGMRTKGCRLIAGALCVRVEPIVIWPFEHRVAANIEFSINQLAYGDGFDNRAEFFEFFKRTYHEDVLNDFEILFWDTKSMISSKDFVRYWDLADPKKKDKTVKTLVILDGPPEEMAEEEFNTQVEAIAGWELRRKK